MPVQKPGEPPAAGIGGTFYGPSLPVQKPGEPPAAGIGGTSYGPSLPVQKPGEPPAAAAVTRDPSPPLDGGKVADGKKDVDPAELLGLDGIKRIVGRWGFQGKALLTDVRIEAPVPRKGLVGWLDQPAFRKGELPPIPQSTRTFLVDSFDPALAYGRFGELARKIEPETGALIDELEKAAKDITGLRLREDLLSHLGPTWCVLPVPSADGQGGGKAEVDPTEYVLVASLRDADGFSKVLDTLAARANQYLRDREKPD